MTVVFSDNFNRASLGTTNWSDEPGVWSIASSTILQSSTNNRVLNTTTTAHAALADCKVKFKRASATFDGAAVCRSNVSGASSSVGACYILNPFGTQFDVIRRSGGVNTTLSGGLTSLTSANGDVWEVIVQTVGATVTFDVYQNGNLRGQIVDSSGSRITAAGQTGFMTFNTASRFDDFEVDDLVVVSPPPSITDVDEDNTIVSTQTDVEIDGADFDTATVEIRQGSTTVAQSIDSQSSTAIQFDVVFESTNDLKYGDATLAVINDDDQEDTQAIEITAPSGHKYVDITTPDPTAANRITAVADIASGDQLEALNVQGGTIADLTLYADGTFDVAEGVTAFDVRLWDAGDSTWGSVATQSVGAGATGTRRNNLMLMGVG